MVEGLAGHRRFRGRDSGDERLFRRPRSSGVDLMTKITSGGVRIGRLQRPSSARGRSSMARPASLPLTEGGSLRARARFPRLCGEWLA